MTKTDHFEPFFSDKNFNLFQVDCIDFISQLPKASIDLIFADPPYNLSNGGFTCKSGRRASVDKGVWDKSHGSKSDFEFHLNWITACKRVLKDNGSIWISGTYHSIYACGFALQTAGYQILNDICWFKPNAPPNLSARYFTASHETLIWARKNKKGYHTFNYQLTKNDLWEGDPLKKRSKQMRSVWSIPSPKSSEKKFGKHPTQKPWALLKRIILSTSQEGDTVLDPFCGSGTTGLVAHHYDRKFIGLDTEPKYLEIVVQRYKNSNNNF
ncbi:MAG: site-specific DNA-methyltransferase [Methanoregulaceae archaeon]|jgi:site-specific DNA-methyltransferase (adenine-specific)